mgnify:CR=1 FL=1
MMYGRAFWGNNGCFGFNYFSYWHFIVIGVIIVLLFVALKNKNTKNNDEIIDILDKKFVNGEISEEEYLNKKNNFMAILPYYLKKVINILLAWCISYTIFSIFYTKVESLLFVLNPNINFVLFENLPKITFIIPIIVSTVLMLFASLFIKKGGSKRWKEL